MNKQNEHTPPITIEEEQLFAWMRSSNFFGASNNRAYNNDESTNCPTMKNEGLLRIDGVDTSDEESKKMAAYAINLCTVSVSQIIDYDDIHVLEQEYEAILNNLNIENMPKDEALLQALKQILDTITFFRIQEGDKKMLQKSYERKVKDAIWNAVPNFGMIVGGNPITMAISLASMVGMGYMNYRREKAKIQLENEQQQWQLQRSAIEQFNALRRELFDTAWRLSDKYQFKDNYRLTEKQIAQYDEILMDPNSLRRYQRLWNIRTYFEAFPPFWYYIGSAANQVYHEYGINGDNTDEVISEHFRQNAIDAFEKYLDIHGLDLLRVDQVRTSCDLEYTDILLENYKDYTEIPAEEYAKILNLVDDAYLHSGRATDVMQSCAIKYLQLNQLDKAQDVLLELIVENSNATTNAYLLNGIYMKLAFMDESKYLTYQQKYNVLRVSATNVNLLPWPTKEELMASNNDKAIAEKQKSLIYTTSDVVSKLLDKYELLFKKALLYSPAFDQYSNDIYSNEHSTERKGLFLDYATQHLRQYQQSLHKEGIRWRVYSVTNEFIKTLDDLYNILLMQNNSIETTLSECVEKSFYKQIKCLDASMLKLVDNLTCEDNSKESFPSKEYDELDKITFKSAMQKCKKQYEKIITNGIKECKEMRSLAKAEEDLSNFCINNGIDLHAPKQSTAALPHSNSILEKGFDVENCQQMAQLDEQIRKVIERHIPKIQNEKMEVVGLKDEEKALQIDKEVLETASGDYILVYLLCDGKPILYFTRSGIIARERALVGKGKWHKCNYKDVSTKGKNIFTGDVEVKINIDSNILQEICKQIIS